MAVDADQAIDDLVLPLPVNDQPMEDAYAIDSVIGEGSYSTVHAATRRCNGEHVVVKAIRVDTLDTDEQKSALQEAQTLSHLRHTNIIRYHDVRYNERESTLYIIMEHAAGGDLGALIKQQASHRRPFTEDFILLAFVQITLALSYVHARGFLHRDIKPSNTFLLGHDNIVKLGDFGLAKMVQATDNLAETTVGTPCYRSPEMCENKPYSAKSDIWSLGCLLYELTTLKRAFEGKTLPVLVVNILHGRFSPVPSRFSVHLRSLIRSMLAQNPSRRPTADSILKLPWMQPYLHQYSELMRRQLPDSCPPRMSDGSACSADAMTLAMPPTVRPIRTTAAGSPTAAMDTRPLIQHPVADTRTKAACREVRRLLGNVHASLSARLKETPSAAGASFRCGLTKGKAAVAGARMRAAATHQIRSFCPSDVTDMHIAPVLKPTWVPGLAHGVSSNGAGTSMMSMGPEVSAVKRATSPAACMRVLLNHQQSCRAVGPRINGRAGGSGVVKELLRDSSQSAQPETELGQPDLESLSSLSSVCSQPTRTDDDTAPWGSIVPIQGITLSSPQPKPEDMLDPAVAVPPERGRPRTPPLPRHSISPELPPRSARNKPPRLTLADPSCSSCSMETGTARADLRSARDMARDTHKDNRHANGQQLVSPAWLKDNLAALDQMRGALSASMEFRQEAGSARMGSHSFISSRASPTPTNGTDMSATAPAEAWAASASPTPSLAFPLPQLGHAMEGEQSVDSSPRRETGSPCALCGEPAQADARAPPKPRRTNLGSRHGVRRMRPELGREAGLKRAAQANPAKTVQVPVPVLSSSSSALSLPLARSAAHSYAGKRLHRCKSDMDARQQKPQRSGKTLSEPAVVAKDCMRTDSTRPVKDMIVRQTRPRWGNIQRAAVVNRSVKKAEPPKAQERAEARKRAAELQAAHRFALKHVQARVRREDIKNCSSVTSRMSLASRRASRPDAPAFVIPAMPHNDKPGEDDTGAGASSLQAKSPKRQGDVQHRGQAHHQDSLQAMAAGGQKQGGAANTSVSGGHGSAASGGSGPERNAGKVVTCRPSGIQMATFRVSPAVDIFVPQCSPKGDSGDVAPRAADPGQAIEASAEQLPASEPLPAEPQPAADVASAELPDRTMPTCVAGCLPSRERWYHTKVAEREADSKLGGQRTVCDAADQPCAGVPAALGSRCTKGQDACLQKLAMDTHATPGHTTGTQKGPVGMGVQHVKCATKAASLQISRGAGSAPGRVSCANRTEAGKATAAKVEELRVRLEAQLGEDKLLAAYRFLDSGAGMAPAGVVPPQLEALLAPHTHFAYAVYRLRMMEDMVFG